MLYSSCKNPVVDQVKDRAGLEVVKTVRCGKVLKPLLGIVAAEGAGATTKNSSSGGGRVLEPLLRIVAVKLGGHCSHTTKNSSNEAGRALVPLLRIVTVQRWEDADPLLGIETVISWLQ